MSNIRVKKRNGRLENFEVNKINKFVERACENLSGVAASEVVLDMQILFYICSCVRSNSVNKNYILRKASRIYKLLKIRYILFRFNNVINDSFTNKVRPR